MNKYINQNKYDIDTIQSMKYGFYKTNPLQTSNDNKCYNSFGNYQSNPVEYNDSITDTESYLKNLEKPPSRYISREEVQNDEKKYMNINTSYVKSCEINGLTPQFTKYNENDRGKQHDRFFQSINFNDNI